MALLALLGGCATAPPPLPPTPAPPSSVPHAGTDNWYQQAAAAGQQVLRIDAQQSLITITARRGGAFARMGHDHVVASRSVTGFVAPGVGRADFSFRLDQMSVDESALRTEAGLDTQPSAEDIAGTRKNMLTRVLEAERFPLVTLHAERLPGAADTLRLAITLHGVTRSVDVPVLIERSQGTLTASGRLTILQSDFGITPMSIMGGALTVKDALELRFRIVARAVPAA